MSKRPSHNPESRMRTATAKIAGVVLSLALALAAGCGGEKEVKSELSTTKYGQQLADLKQALDAGKITQDEYTRERARLLKGN